jgi:5-methylthioribose kinase
VHGDFSPKNLLVSGVGSHRLMLVDFEVGHFGDPAFDVGFFLSHLVLKAYWSGARCDEYFGLTEAFWSEYLAGMGAVAGQAELGDLIARGIRNFAACMLARIDGKSKVEYLTDEALRETVRRTARNLLLTSPDAWEAVREEL